MCCDFAVFVCASVDGESFFKVIFVFWVRKAYYCKCFKLFGIDLWCDDAYVKLSVVLDVIPNKVSCVWGSSLSALKCAFINIVNVV